MSHSCLTPYHQDRGKHTGYQAFLDTGGNTVAWFGCCYKHLFLLGDHERIPTKTYILIFCAVIQTWRPVSLKFKHGDLLSLKFKFFLKKKKKQIWLSCSPNVCLWNNTVIFSRVLYGQGCT